VRSPTESRADVSGERADVRARRAGDLDREDAVGDGLVDAEGVDGDRPRLALDLLALPGEICMMSPVSPAATDRTCSSVTPAMSWEAVTSPVSSSVLVSVPSTISPT
jgi:hypothetical protein